MCMRILLNLTSADPSLSQELAKKNAFVMGLASCAFRCLSQEQSLEPENIDSSMLSVGLLVNILEHCPHLKVLIGPSRTFSNER